MIWAGLMMIWFLSSIHLWMTLFLNAFFRCSVTLLLYDWHDCVSKWTRPGTHSPCAWVSSSGSEVALCRFYHGYNLLYHNHWQNSLYHDHRQDLPWPLGHCIYPPFFIRHFVQNLHSTALKSPTLLPQVFFLIPSLDRDPCSPLKCCCVLQGLELATPLGLRTKPYPAWLHTA